MKVECDTRFINMGSFALLCLKVSRSFFFQIGSLFEKVQIPENCEDVDLLNCTVNPKFNDNAHIHYILP